MSAKLLGAWSPSKQEKWERCPLSAYFAYNEHRVKTPRVDLRTMNPLDMTPAERGTLYHAYAEDYLLRGAPLDAVLAQFYITKFTALKKHFEDPACVASSEHMLKFVVENDGRWVQTMGPDYDAISVIDALVIRDGHATVIDYKTGDPKNKKFAHSQQGLAYALAVLRAYPDVQTVETQFWYVEHPLSNMLVHRYDRYRFNSLARYIDYRVLSWGQIQENHCIATAHAGNCTYCDFESVCIDRPFR